MNLKSFHIFFVTVSTLMSFGFGGWCWRYAGVNQSTGFRLLGYNSPFIPDAKKTLGQIGWVWFRHRKVDQMLWVSLGIICVFGGATLLLRDETFSVFQPLPLLQHALVPTSFRFQVS